MTVDDFIANLAEIEAQLHNNITIIWDLIKTRGMRTCLSTLATTEEEEGKKDTDSDHEVESLEKKEAKRAS